MKNIVRKIGDIRDVEEGMIYHGCNNANAMGAGVALAIAKKYPIVKKCYHALFRDAKRIGVGIHLGYVHFVTVLPNLIVANAITQDGYGSDDKEYATVDAIERSLSTCAVFVEDCNKKPEINMPQVGGKRGGLNFEKDVMPAIERVAEQHPNITFVIWEYDNRDPQFS